jgi:hypothetical protein
LSSNKDKKQSKGLLYELVNNNNGRGGGVEPNAGRHLATAPRNLEQGDRKTFSPESANTGKPPIKKRAGHSHTISGVEKPHGLVLQQPSYY